MADALFSLIAHPLTVVADILCEPLGASAIPSTAPRKFGSRYWIDRRLSRELGRYLDHRLVDQYRDWIEVARVGFQAQPLRFQRQGTAAGEGIMKRRQLVPVEQLARTGIIRVIGAGSTPALPDFVPRLLQHGFVGGVLPLHQLLDDAEQAGALFLLRLLGRKQVWEGRRVIHHLRKDHGACGRKRPPGPPQMQRARVPVPDGFFARRGGVDRIQRQRDFDQLSSGARHGSSICLERE